MKLTEMVDQASDVFSDYVGIELPCTEIAKVLNSDKWLMKEISRGCVRDTMVRESLIDAFCKLNGLPAWPSYGNSDAFKDDFYTKLKIKVTELGGTFE